MRIGGAWPNWQTDPNVSRHADDVSSIQPCREYVARLKQNGVDIQLTEFSDAHHSFDAFFLTRLVTNPQAMSTRNCRLDESDNGQLITRMTGKPLTPTDACVEPGNTYAYNEAAAAATTEAVKTILTATLR